MVVNGKTLFDKHPVEPMLDHKVRTSVCSHGLAEAGYDMTIQQDIHYYWNQGNPEILWFDPVSGEHGIKRGKFILANTVEKFTMPNDLVGIVHDKSTWARLGVAVQNTVVEPNYFGNLTIEINFQDQNEVHIPAGSGICQILFHKLAEPGHYNGKYQNQTNKPVEAIMG